MELSDAKLMFHDISSERQPQVANDMKVEIS